MRDVVGTAPRTCRASRPSSSRRRSTPSWPTSRQFRHRPPRPKPARTAAPANPIDPRQNGETYAQCAWSRRCEPCGRCRRHRVPCRSCLGRRAIERHDQIRGRRNDGRRDGFGQGQRRHHHHDGLHRRRRPLLFPAAAERPLPGVGAGAVVRHRQGRRRSRRQQQTGLHAHGAVRRLFPATAGRSRHGVAAGSQQRRQAAEKAGREQLHRLPPAELSAAASFRRSRLDRRHRPDEACQRVGHLSRPRSQGAGR